MRLPTQAIDGTGVVGPFFWWAYVEDPNDDNNAHLRKIADATQLIILLIGVWSLEFVFRKSDVQWKGTSRGWEMVLSYSFLTRITSGYIRGTTLSGIKEAIEFLGKCAQPTYHPLLLPLFLLILDLSSKNEKDQRNIRSRLREFESAVTKRYKTAPAKGYAETGIGLDSFNRELADLQCQAMWKRPQAWRNAVQRMNAAMACFWEKLPFKNQVHELRDQQRTMLQRLDFIMVRLEGLESYAQVSLERLNIQREVVRHRLGNCACRR